VAGEYQPLEEEQLNTTLETLLFQCCRYGLEAKDYVLIVSRICMDVTLGTTDLLPTTGMEKKGQCL